MAIDGINRIAPSLARFTTLMIGTPIRPTVNGDLFLGGLGEAQQRATTYSGNVPDDGWQGKQETWPIAV